MNHSKAKFNNFVPSENFLVLFESEYMIGAEVFKKQTTDNIWYGKIWSLNMDT